MPYPSEHAARTKDPANFEKDSFRRKQIAPGISIIIGKEKGGNGSMVTQSYRFSKDKFTADEAKAWLKDHKVNYISFETAISKNQEQIVTNQYQQINQDGKDFLVIPGVILHEQVMNSWLVPADEIENCSVGWNGRPVVIEHPQENDGSANVPNPDVPIIGQFFNSQWDAGEKKLRGEVWVEVAEAEKTQDGMAILNMIRTNQPIEISTGYYADTEWNKGEFGGRKYDRIHRNLLPDHIAMLPKKVGACSLKDGCGMNVNCASCPDTSLVINVLSKSRHPEYSGTEDTSWANVTKTVESYISGYEKTHGIKDVPRNVADLPQGVKSWIAGKTLLGDPKADNERDLMMFPVVNPGTNKLNAGALRAVLGGRGSAANIPAAARESAQNMARNLLQKEFHSKEAHNMKLPELFAFLKKKGLKVTANEEEGEQVFEVEEETVAAPAPVFSEEEVAALKSLAASGPAILNALKDIPAAIQMAQNAQTQAAAQRTELVEKIKANTSNPYSDEELAAMPVSAIVKLNAQLNTSYLAAGGGAFSKDKKPLTPPPALLAQPEKKEA
jgi:hypothetical protein